MQTALFRQQHKEILAVVGELSSLCSGSASTVSQKAADIRAKLVALTGKVNVHLSAEDKSLYPLLFAKEGLPAAKIASTFAAEMGSLAGAFKQFVANWPTGDAIASGPDKFVQEFNGIVKALGNRIEREEKDLYPLADAL